MTIANVKIGKVCEKHPELLGLRDIKHYCLSCKAERKKKYYLENKDRILVQKKNWVIKNPEKSAEYSKAWVNKNIIRSREIKKKWFDSNKEYYAKYYIEHRDVCKARNKINGALWKKNNPEKHCAQSSKQRAGKLKATPIWANDFFIEEIYDLAQRRTKATGFEWHVDHIVPLQSKFVCGLHVEHNLQVIPATHNLSKGNRHWPGMPRSAT